MPKRTHHPSCGWKFTGDDQHNFSILEKSRLFPQLDKDSRFCGFLGSSPHHGEPSLGSVGSATRSHFPRKEWSCARQNCSELPHLSACEPELILFSLSPCLADSYGNIEPALEPVWALAVAGSSSIMWEKSTETLGYFLAQVKSVRQWVSGAQGHRSPKSQGLLLSSSSPSTRAPRPGFAGELSLPGCAGVALQALQFPSSSAEPSTLCPDTDVAGSSSHTCSTSSTWEPCGLSQLGSPGSAQLWLLSSSLQEGFRVRWSSQI